MTDQASDQGTDWAAVYRAATDQVVAIGGGLTDDQLARTVLASPDWTVRQVYAHLAGCPASFLAGDAEDAPSTEWTARHVAARSGASLEELLAEITAVVDPALEMLGDNPQPALVWDRSVHLADLHEALGLPQPPAATWEPILAAVRPMLAGAVGDADPPDYELYRAAFSRRSQDQLATLLPDATPEQLAEIGVFGPRDDDQPRPAGG